ncbi:MAG: NAD(P)H:quinone oxidoreductase [Candidatus Hydrogenedentes bacterium ADurb.Bin179]|nr:MAG: NAD(P)H:quinone oxidoreductase [Candidatus Hydrogenedentes bacterium ADurb.Bin179]
MSREMTRRALLASAALGMAGADAAQDTAAKDADKILVVGVSCSPRNGMTTATAMAAALEAAKGVDQRITTELIDLGGMRILGSDGNSSAQAVRETDDDFIKVLPTLDSPNLCAMIIGSPSYYRSMSSLCKAFLEKLAVFREPTMRLADVPVGALSVASNRNGGQELVIEQILMAMLSYGAVIVGGKGKGPLGATLWNAFENDITQDELGMESARNLGIRVAEAALKYKG